MIEWLMLALFFVLLIAGIPIAICIGTAAMVTMMVVLEPLPALTTVAQRMAGGINSFPLLAIPLFVLAGNIMSRGGMAGRLITLARRFMAGLPGGLAIVNVVACTLFGAVSGSAIAATTAIGGVMVPAMEKDRYPAAFGAALTATAATTGLLIPPSNILIIYAVASGGVSIAALFIAGYLPGLLLALCLMLVAMAYAHRTGAAGSDVVSDLPSKRRALLDAGPSLLLIVVIIGGIVGGAFTATEAGAIAVFYAWALSALVYRELPCAALPELLLRSAMTSATVMILVGTSIAMSWLLAFQDIPATVADNLLSLSDNPILLLLLINLVLLLVGSVMDMTPAVMIFTPIFLPVAVQLGMSPLHFGIMMVLNLSIGLCTPPVGSVLFVSCAVAKTSVQKMIKPLLPLYGAMLTALLLVTCVPSLSEALPRALGLFE